MGLMDRLFGSVSPPIEIASTPKRLLIADASTGSTNGVKNLPIETKANSLALLPGGAYGPALQFFSPDGGVTMIDMIDGPTALAFIAYWHIGTRWKAQKLAESPLMIIEEDQESGNEEWLPKHDLVSILDGPSPDYDMGELIECTSHYLDNTGGALWTIDKNKNQEIIRLTPFSRNQFEPLPGIDEHGNPRLFAAFRVTTREGPLLYLAEDVCFFRDVPSSMGNTTTLGRDRSRLDVAMSWLKLSLRTQQTIYDLLNNSVWPSMLLIPDKDWDPDEDAYKAYIQDVAKYAKVGQKGKPFVMLGGGSAQTLQSQLKDIVPTEIMNRVESVIAAIIGIPAVVLQFEVGIQNSPWSQMGQARRMAYEDTIEPMWKKMERTMTRQLLRPLDEDTTHFVRFDRSNVAALTKDQYLAAQTATLMGRAASLNERRAVLGLEPSADPKADEIPELTQPSLQEILAGNGAKPDATATATATAKDPTAKDPAQEQNPADASKKRFDARQLKTVALLSAFREEQSVVWKLTTHHNLQLDRDAIASIVESMITPAVGKSRESKARGKDRAMSAVAKFLNEDSRSRWTKAISPVAQRSAQRAGAVIAGDLNVNYNLIHTRLNTFAAKQTKTLVTGVNKTTQSLVNDIVQGGLDANASNKEIAQLIRDATGFDAARAELIARTETTRAFNGAPTESLAELGKATGVTYTKTWSGVLDDRERDEHVDLEGETVNVDDAFSNGLDYPSEPNCRCTLLFADAGDAGDA